MKILFLCVANSARSQLAEGLARQALPDAEIQSAGSQPGKLNPYAVKAMKEVGIDISSHYSKSVDGLSPDFLAGLDYVITLCAEEVCPVLASKAKKLRWPLPDPATKESMAENEMLNRFRSARDAISEKLKLFKADLQ
ncbi:MAG: arsenate reductase ArsC [Bdellovibrionota bacterium]